jgi:hypothetical protein
MLQAVARARIWVANSLSDWCRPFAQGRIHWGESRVYAHGRALHCPTCIPQACFALPCTFSGTSLCPSPWNHICHNNPCCSLHMNTTDVRCFSQQDLQYQVMHSNKNSNDNHTYIVRRLRLHLISRYLDKSVLTQTCRRVNPKKR